MMRLAYFSPLGPQRTGIADYSEELLPHLARAAEIELFVDNVQPTNPAIVQQFPIFNYREFPARHRDHPYDMPVYHMGNSPYHIYIYDTLVRYPGVTVLHDYVLHHFWRDLADLRGRYRAYERELVAQYGPRGLDLARVMLCDTPLGYQTLFKYPLSGGVVRASRGVIVHSAYAQRQLAEAYPTIPLRKINSHLSPASAEAAVLDPLALRAQLGLKPEAFVIASFGHLSPHKRTHIALRAFARLQRVIPEAVFLLVGESPPSYSIKPLLQDLGLHDAVRLTGYVPMSDFQRYLAVSDVCVNLRYPTAGETSASLIRIMGQGVAVIVSNVDAFMELPDACCAKVDVGPQEEDQLLAYLLAFARYPALRRQMGQNAQAYVHRHHRLEDSARGYIEFIESLLARSRTPPSPKRSGTNEKSL